MNAGASPEGRRAIAIAPGDGGAQAACCSLVYGNPLAELLVGQSMHPGGLEGTRELLGIANLLPGTRLLDAGCGPGASARLAATEFCLRVDAIDSSQALIDRARATRSDRTTWRQADLLALPDEAETYDAALAECVLSIIPRKAALAELRRVLRPGGRLLLSDVEVRAPIPELDEIGLLGSAICVSTAWQPNEMDDRLPEAGFRIDIRRDRTSAIPALIDRIEARARLLATAARDLGVEFATIAPVLVPAGVTQTDLKPATIRRLASIVRAAVERGDLRYRAVVATAK